MFDRLKDVVGWYNRGIAYARILVTDSIRRSTSSSAPRR
jgi:hypothetical protein